MAKHNEIGKQGEELACTFLISIGYEIVQRNYRFSKGEIDIIAYDKNTLVFVEVKTRTSEFEFPELAVNHKKQNLLTETADQFIYEQKLNNEIRFDIVTVVIQDSKHKIHHIKDAFFQFGI